MSTVLHILRGTGSNCTCGDCAVLYGGTCGTTRMNNMLDQFDLLIEKTLVTKGKNPSEYQSNKLFRWLCPRVCKLEKISPKQFNSFYYCFAVLIFMAWGTTPEVRKTHMYRRARMIAYGDIMNQIKKPL